MTNHEKKQSGPEMARVLQQLEDETLIFRREEGARGILEDPQDTRHEEARRLLELRPAIRRRTDLGLPYNDIMTEFRDLCDRVREKNHKTRSVPKNRRAPKEWAEALANHLIERGARDKREAREMMELGIEIDEDYGFYMDGDKVIFRDPVTDKDVDDMTWGNFEKRYLRPKLHSLGQIRR